MSLPAQYEISPGELWNHYKNQNLKDFVSLDHIVLATRKDNNQPVWTRVSN